MKVEISQMKIKLVSQIRPIFGSLVKTRSAIAQLQDGLSEASLLLQTFQAASYNGTFIWKIPEVTRRRQEARTYRRGLHTAPVQERNPEASMKMVMSSGETLITSVRQKATYRTFPWPVALCTAPVQECNQDASTTMITSRQW